MVWYSHLFQNFPQFIVIHTVKGFGAYLERKKKVSPSVVSDSAAPWTAAHQAPPSMGFSRQEYWSGVPFPSPGDRPDPGIEPRAPALQADALPSEPPRKQAKNGKWKCQKLGTREGSK